MAYKIADTCVNCGACVEACPVTAIAEREGIHVVDADSCIDCGACSGICPVEAPQAL